MKSKAKQRTLVTSALPYANGPIHIGHLAGAYLPADMYVRYKRLKGEDIVYICGSDEHGVPIMMRARTEGVSPQEIVDRYHKQIKESFAAFGMSFDYYGRTSSPVHHETSQDFFTVLADKGVFSLKTEEQLYDPEAGIFLADRFIRGTCPICGYTDAYGDQCEKCGSSLSPSDLIEPRSAITNATPVLKETAHWYLPLADHQPQLESWIGTRKGWKANVLGQVKSWFAEGLKERAMTRDLPWGVPVPEEVAARAQIEASGKVLYVWFDAPIGYISATKEWAADQGDEDLWKTYWQDDDTRLIHFIGKDNIVFHCIIFPALLMAHGSFVLPSNVPANEFLNLEGDKLSTSRGWAVWLQEYLQEFPPDLLRYALATTLPEAKDADFSWNDFQARVNSELADVLGNFVNRSVTFAERFFEGKVPPLDNPSSFDLDVLARLAEYPEKIGQAYESFRLREAVAETMSLARLGNKYFNDTEPWHTRKSDPRACANTIHVSLQLSAALSILFDPVLPHTCETLREMLNLRDIRSSGADRLQPGSLGWDAAGTSLLPEEHVLGESRILFTKIEDDVIAAQVSKLKKRAAKADGVAVDTSPDVGHEPVKPEINFDDFARLDLRIGRVTEAEPVPKADKLLRLQVDLGFETRQILAGIAEQIQADQILGKHVVVVANLAPRKLRGFESQGMILMAEDSEGRFVTVSAEAEPGSVVR